VDCERTHRRCRLALERRTGRRRTRSEVEQRASRGIGWGSRVGVCMGAGGRALRRTRSMQRHLRGRPRRAHRSPLCLTRLQRPLGRCRMHRRVRLPDVQPIHPMMHCGADLHLGPGTAVHAVGFGNAVGDSDDESGGVKRTGVSEIINASSASPLTMPSFAPWVPGKPLKGDSGSPLLVRLPKYFYFPSSLSASQLVQRHLGTLLWDKTPIRSTRRWWLDCRPSCRVRELER